MKLNKIVSVLFMFALFYSEAEARVGVGFNVWNSHDSHGHAIQVVSGSESTIGLMDINIRRESGPDEDGDDVSSLLASIGLGAGVVLASDEDTNISLGFRAGIDWYRFTWDWGWNDVSDNDVDVFWGPFVRGEYFIGDRFSIAGISGLSLAYPGHETDTSVLAMANNITLTWYLGN